MSETKPKRRWFSFSIRELLLFTVIVALAIGWWMDNRRLVADTGKFLIRCSASMESFQRSSKAGGESSWKTR